MILIYTHKITNRSKYIFKLLLKELLHIDFQFTANELEYLAFEGMKFSYSNKPFDKGLFFASTNILFERGIKHLDISMTDYEGLPAFFPVYQNTSAMPFDPFAASFYLVSRYEEYLPYKKDEYGRFPADESLAYRKKFLHKPMINIWAQQIGDILSSRFPQLKIAGQKYKFVPTLDIDAAWSYKGKGLFRTVGGYLNSLSNFEISDISERTKVIFNLQKDPFDTFEFQLEIQKKYNLKPIYFILYADYGLNDKNIPVQNRKFQTLIKSLADYAEVGIHPSYNSNFNSKKLKLEISRLSKVLNREITKSRQHFLKVHLPVTYRNLINLDITDDYSMGYAAQPGFRASICNSFCFYDVDLDVETKLRIHPFTVMEGTLKDYLKLSPREAVTIMKRLIAEVKGVNGTFISLWHNESLSNTKRWEGWRDVYEEMIIEALP
ncbi:MAG: polysaccharide deacetylase family protein [Bacteroidales bacterium]